MGNAYRVITLDLTLAADRRQIVGRDVGITTVTVLQLPAATVFELHFGQKEGVPILDQGFLFDELCPPEDQGLFGTWPAQAGVQVRLYVGFGSGRAVLE